MLSEHAYQKLAELLNIIEEGVKWPTQMETARAAFMAKDLDNALNPLAYRVLLMLPAVYRLWARTRPKHLQPWIDDWAMPEMYAGIANPTPGSAVCVRCCVPRITCHVLCTVINESHIVFVAICSVPFCSAAYALPVMRHAVCAVQLCVPLRMCCVVVCALRALDIVPQAQHIRQRMPCTM